MDEALTGELEDRLLEGADEVQLTEHRREQPGIGGLPVRRRRGELLPLRTGRNVLEPRHPHLP
jgi:hypothetical protein